MRKRSLLSLLPACLVLLASSFFHRSAAQNAPRQINVVAKRFAYEPAEITLKKGDPVVLTLTAADVAHGIAFEELNLSTRISKGRPAELSFTPTQTGDFVGHCSVFCGSGHGSMTLTLHVVN